MRKANWNKIIGTLFLTAVLAMPVWGDVSHQHSAAPGTLNYVEGQASIGDETLNSKSVGSAQLDPGQVLETDNGKAEVLLTPGVYVRLGSNSALKMVSPDLANTQVALDQGEAMVEVDEIHPQNDIRVSQPGGVTRLLKTGLYDFDASTHEVRVFDGKAEVQAGDHQVTVKGGHELALNTEGKLKAQSFDKQALGQTDALYRWSSLRSEYLSEANVDTARIYVANGWYGPGWFGPGWYWSPWAGGFTFLPATGFLYSPFGWGFYSPLVAYRLPVVVGSFSYHAYGFRPGIAYGGGFRVGGFRAAGGFGGFRR
jgi:hypothetical protein